MPDTILTLHPQGKQGVNISRDKYDVVRDAILNSLRAHGELTFADLALAVEDQLLGRFDGSTCGTSPRSSWTSKRAAS